MQVTLEISLYPLDADNYAEAVLQFLAQLMQYEGLQIETNGMSTQVFGEYETAMAAVQTEMKKIYEKEQAILVMKVARGALRYRGSDLAS